MNTETHFRLERYRSGGGNRYVCPQCGRRKCFARYVDTTTGEYVDESCGKCDHEASCGYHYPPRDFFRDHPRWEAEKTLINGSPSVLSRPKPLPQYAVQEVQQTQFFDLRWAERAASRPSTFRTWMEGLKGLTDQPAEVEAQRIQEVLALYYVGATEDDIIVRGANFGPAAVFWQIDEQGRPHDAKLIAYCADGHRVPTWGNWMRSICQKRGMGPQLEQTEKVLFGLHLVPRYPDKPIGLVESEKSALICAVRYPEYVWLATGGCGNLQAQKLRPLMNRRIVVFPDSGEYQKWSQAMRASGHRQYIVQRMMEPYVPNTDIADIILGVARLRESPDEALWREMKAANPALQQLADTFGLQRT